LKEAKDLRIVFMGTPELAASLLGDLVADGYNIVGVVTAPDKPAGRGRKLAASPVKELALEKGLQVLQPEKLKSLQFLEQLEALKPDLQVVVAFRMLPMLVWNLPPLGTFNMHASLLPQYRGAAPINWAIINGEQQTGVTTFLLDHEIDTGKILFREPIPIERWETAGSLHEKIKEAGSSIVRKTIDAIAAGQVKPLGQATLIPPGTELKKAPKIFKEDCRINWEQPCTAVACHIHGLSPVPGAFTTLEETQKEPLTLKIFEARPQKVNHGHPPGTLLSDHKHLLGMTTPDGIVWIKTLQMPGKRRMTAAELLRGHQFSEAIFWKKTPETL
jgi:methionyl-tRNA formyltransferase